MSAVIGAVVSTEPAAGRLVLRTDEGVLRTFLYDASSWVLSGDSLHAASEYADPGAFGALKLPVKPEQRVAVFHLPDNRITILLLAAPPAVPRAPDR